MFPLRRLAARITSALPSAPGRADARPLTTSPVPFKGSNLPPRPKPPPEEDIEEKFVKGSGPGGQKIENKTNSAVQLKHIPTGIVVKSQATRSRSQNRQIARSLLAARLDEIANGDTSRAAALAEKKKRKRANKMKKSHRKYRALEKGKEAVEESEQGLEGEEQERGEAEPGKEGEGTAGEGTRPGGGKPADRRE